ncbi:ankyrin repeat and sterile alpha motif domain-containing protein 1B-like [Mercenaria mercenaria]|uniref:ankyrin repeat and sterile alpha motif domain-containing protein 1B-like n=1 Tax=Mercenaria mercenaria TaxID=6596 RepID=UPI00234E5231|nr:ankyrin repeat and sterile alpha motif domain-containing protein 1B-like [Mercenaria mercenaria]XP_053377469.1 ankyrin repeat and sterile alpha motif domain-containing protein 1B-like [Mercenaria mercenaria]
MGLAASRQEAFWEACGFGHVQRARHFLEEGDIDVNWVSYTNDCCPIHVASQGKPDIVQLLLQHKCNVNVRDNRENLPLHHAAMKGHADIVQTLLDAGSEINAQEKNGWTALHNAAYWCHPEVVRVLLKNGCDVHIQNKDERTALHECARSQQTDDQKLGEIAQILVDAGCDINSKSSDWGEADLTGLMYASFHNHPDVASVLIEAGCQLNSVGTTFWSALHWAADRGNDELVYILLDAGIDPTIRDMRGETAADRAQTDEIRQFIATAIDIQKELNRVKQPVIRPARQLCKPEEPFKPKCDANFKSQSFLPKDWKPSSSINVKNLIIEKKSRLAAMTSQKYRNELAKRTGTDVIKDKDVKKSGEEVKLEEQSKESSDIEEGAKDLDSIEDTKNIVCSDGSIQVETESNEVNLYIDGNIVPPPEDPAESSGLPEESFDVKICDTEGQPENNEVIDDIGDSDKISSELDEEETTEVCASENKEGIGSQNESKNEALTLNSETDEINTALTVEKGDNAKFKDNIDTNRESDSHGNVGNSEMSEINTAEGTEDNITPESHNISHDS